MTTLPGIDISAVGQGPNFDWTPWKGRLAFAFAKISEGSTFTDPDGAKNITAARQLGIIPGGYHLIHAADDGAAQAGRFLKLAQPKPGDLIMVDVEEAGYDGLGPDRMSGAVGKFADVIRAQTGSWPVTYTNISTAQGGYCASVGMTPLFLANPSRIQIGRVGPWPLISFEQIAERGTDTDLFYGDLVALRRLTVMHAPPPPSPAPTPVRESWRLEWTSAAAAPGLVRQTSSDGVTWR